MSKDSQINNKIKQKNNTLPQTKTGLNPKHKRNYKQQGQHSVVLK